MSPETATVATKLCPTCGTRVSDDATRCLVCGADLGTAAKPAQPAKGVQGSRMPAITLSLPAAIFLLALFLIIGAVMVFFALREQPALVVPSTPTETPTLTATPTLTNTPMPPTATFTPAPTATPLVYTVQSLDTCTQIALNFGVSVQSIINLNKLTQDCFLSPNATLLIPQPTPTVTPLPTSTLSVEQATEAACEKVSYMVKENDTLSTIAFAHGVPMQAIKDENGLPGDSVYLDQPLIIPLCKRPTPAGPTPTATLPPPYPAPNLLLPANGAFFTLADDTVTLQWAAVGTLRENEAYLVVIEDLTGGTGRKLNRTVNDTKLIVPSSFRPVDKDPHILSWYVQAVRQSGTDKDGNPIWEATGAASPPRYFTWTGVASAATPTP